MKAVTIVDGATQMVDMLDYRSKRSVQQTCKHEREVISGSKSGWPADTCTIEYFCRDCLRYRYEELTMAEMEAAENEAKGRAR